MKYKYPIPVTKNFWRVRCGGLSSDIRPQEAGINKAALEDKELPIKARIEVREYKEDHFSYRSSVYHLLPLDDSTPHALEKSPNGELVLPKKRGAVVRRPKDFYKPTEGKKLVVHVLQE